MCPVVVQPPHYIDGFFPEESGHLTLRRPFPTGESNCAYTSDVEKFLPTLCGVSQKIEGHSMPLSDQRLKDLKACILAFHQHPGQPIDDTHPTMINFFSTLERIFRHGLKNGTSRDLWNWIERLPSYTSDSGYYIPYQLLKAINEAKKSSRVTTAQGKGRLFLRTLVHRKLLENLLQLLRDNPVLVLRHYEIENSLFTDDILSEILRSLFAELARLDFQLDLDNADFLDETWELAVMKELQFVPCSRLGLGVQICGKHYIVTDIKPYSFVLDEDSVELGDVISEFVGRPLHGTALDLKQLLIHHGRRPITMKVVKLRSPSGRLFQPLVAVLLNSNLERLLARVNSPPAESTDGSTEYDFQWPVDEDLICPESACSSTSRVKHRMRYAGCCSVGPNGSIRFMPEAILHVLNLNPDPRKYLPVSLIAGELDFSIWRLDSQRGDMQFTSNDFEILVDETRQMDDDLIDAVLSDEMDDPDFGPRLNVMSKGPARLLIVAKGPQGVHEAIVPYILTADAPSGESTAPADGDEAEPPKQIVSIQEAFGGGDPKAVIKFWKDKSTAESMRAKAFPDFVPAKVIVYRKEEVKEVKADETPDAEDEEADEEAEEVSSDIPDYGGPPRSVVLVRPSANAAYRNDIIETLKSSGFEVQTTREFILTEEAASEFYEDMASFAIFNDLIKEMTSGPILIIVVAKEDAYKTMRELLGPESFSHAQENSPQSLRAMFSSLPDVEKGDDMTWIDATLGAPETQKQLLYFFPIETTFALIKPESVVLQEELLEIIRGADFKIAAKKEHQLTPEELKVIYERSMDKPFYDDLVDYLCQ
nr:unnamed protein product [Spirometra erinaceieuropaei]